MPMKTHLFLIVFLGKGVPHPSTLPSIVQVLSFIVIVQVLSFIVIVLVLAVSFLLPFPLVCEWMGDQMVAF